MPFDPIGWVAGVVSSEREQDQADSAAATARQAAEREAQRNREFQSLEAQRARDFLAQQQTGAQQFSREEAERQRLAAATESYLASQRSDYAAREQRAWTKDMSDTAHQREAKDLAAAGLNRILSISKGGPGASSTGGAASSASPSSQAAASSTAGGTAQAAGSQANIAMANKASYSHIVSGAVQAARTKAEIPVLEMEERLKDAQRSYTSQLWNTSRAQEELTNQETATEKHRTEQAKHQAEILGATAKGAKLEGEIDETKYGELMRYINRALDAVRSGSSAYRNTQPRPDVIINRR